MELNITSKKEKEYLLIISKSKMSMKEDLLTHAESVYNEISKHDAKKVLVNGTEVTFPQSLFAYFDLVKFYINGLPMALKTIKIAVVIKEADKKVVEYWEVVCANKGFEFRAFINFKEAENWLNKGNTQIRFS